MNKTLLFLCLGGILLQGCGKAPVNEDPFAESGMAQTQVHPAAVPQPEDEPANADAGLRNPFLDSGTFAAGEKTKSVLPAEGLTVTAILYSGSDFSKAIINGRISRIGDPIGNKTIIRIDPECVVLKDDQNEYTAKIGDIK